MITTIFSKSKPLNFIIVFAITVIAFVALLIKQPNTALSSFSILARIGLYLIVFASILVLDFVVLKNFLFQKGNYHILLFSLLILSIPQSLLDYKIIISNFCILLALRRVISIRSEKEMIKKLFDSGLLIGVASLFYFWSILFFLVIIFALLFFSETFFKFYLAPFFGLIAVAIMAICLSLVLYNDYLSFFTIKPSVSFDFSNYNTTSYVIAITMLFSYGLWASLFYIRDISKKIRSYRPVYRVLFLFFLIAFTIIILGPNKDGSEFLFLFAPLAVVITNYIEVIEEQWFKELFVGLIIVIPIGLLFV